ncbi:unnamed protein product [Effrenium voratum]|nr:unnamed protein product [Effrenium voratum]
MTSFNLVNTLLFPAPESSYDLNTFPEEELIWLPRSLDPDDPDVEANVPCLFLTSGSARFMMLYLHSNAEDLGRCYNFCNMLRMQFQVNVLAVEYPGYGMCGGGQADEMSVIENARLAFRFITEVLCFPSEDIIILGRSVGSGPALHLAAEARTYGVILICPFLSVKEVVRCHLGRVADFIEERFPNKEKMRQISGFLLIVHGKKDTVVPWTHGQELYDACTRRKRLVTPEDMSHNASLLSDPTIFIVPVLQFFGLPDYNFEPLRIPSWVFDASLTPTSFRTERKVTPRRLGTTCHGRTAPRSHSRLQEGENAFRPMPKQKDSDGLLDAADAVQKFLDWQEAKSVAPRFCELSSRPKSIKECIAEGEPGSHDQETFAEAGYSTNLMTCLAHLMMTDTSKYQDH